MQLCLPTSHSVMIIEKFSLSVVAPCVARNKKDITRKHGLKTEKKLVL